MGAGRDLVGAGVFLGGGGGRGVVGRGGGRAVVGRGGGAVCRWRGVIRGPRVG